jgi:hypothetical protein
VYISIAETLSLKLEIKGKRKVHLKGQSHEKVGEMRA